MNPQNSSSCHWSCRAEGTGPYGTGGSTPFAAELNNRTAAAIDGTAFNMIVLARDSFAPEHTCGTIAGKLSLFKRRSPTTRSDRLICCQSRIFCENRAANQSGGEDEM